MSPTPGSYHGINQGHYIHSKQQFYVSQWLTHTGAGGSVFLFFNSISLCCLIIVYIVIKCNKKWRTIQDSIIRTLVLALIFSTCSFQFNQYFPNFAGFCSYLALLQHYVCLAIFLSLAVYGYDLLRRIKCYTVTGSDIQYNTTSSSMSRLRQSLNLDSLGWTSTDQETAVEDSVPSHEDDARDANATPNHADAIPAQRSVHFDPILDIVMEQSSPVAKQRFVEK